MTSSIKLLRSGYVVVRLPQPILRMLKRICYRSTDLRPGERTDTHTHKFLSFYVVEHMELQTRRGTLPLPGLALVIVLPSVLHGWAATNEPNDPSFVHDLTPMHGPHHVH